MKSYGDQIIQSRYIMNDNVDKNYMTSCKHEFVVRDIDGHNRFLCRECDERFPRHPDMIKQEDPVGSSTIKDILDKFRLGLTTFKEAIEATRFSLSNFVDAITEHYPIEHEQIEELSMCNPIPVLMDGMELPRRTSCPKAIDDAFSDSAATLTDLNDLVANVFLDIQELKHHNSYAGNPPFRHTDIIVVFIDDTRQLVQLSTEYYLAQGTLVSSVQHILPVSPGITSHTVWINPSVSSWCSNDIGGLRWG